MKTVKLRTEIMFLCLGLVLLLSALTSAFGYYIVKKYIVGKAQDQAFNDLKTVKALYREKLQKMEMAFALVNGDFEAEKFRKTAGLDYVFWADSAAQTKSEIVRQAFNEGQSAGGNRIIRKEELQRIGPDFIEKARIELKATPQARPTAGTVLEDALSMEYARPFRDIAGRVSKVLYGGKIINRNFPLIDEISDAVFEKRLYGAKPMGTFTIFLDDVRVATNVLDRDGNRAIGTRVSEYVYNRVVENGGQWLDRAFVVTDWYLTAYEPVRDINGRIIGIFYVGILEKPYIDLERNLLMFFLTIVGFVAVSAILFSMYFASRITETVINMKNAAARISEGDLGFRLKSEVPVKELSQLEASFNLMAAHLNMREQGFKAANEKMAALNKNYLDMIGFVAHELKGLLGSIVMNVYPVKDGYLGELNEGQKRALNAAANTLDHLENMVKNYLDLSRIEKGELRVEKAQVRIGEDVVGPVIAQFEKERQAVNMSIENRVPADLKIMADKSLLTIVCNNLLGNSLKYGSTGGKVVIDSLEDAAGITLRFYNDGQPIAGDQLDLLFKRFSRLPGSEKFKGTGLGLFIVKEIVGKHGGKVWVESKPTGNVFAFTLSRT